MNSIRLYLYQDLCQAQMQLVFSKHKSTFKKYILFFTSSREKKQALLYNTWVEFNKFDKRDHWPMERSAERAEQPHKHTYAHTHAGADWLYPEPALAALPLANTPARHAPTNTAENSATLPQTQTICRKTVFVAIMYLSPKCCTYRKQNLYLSRHPPPNFFFLFYCTVQ